MNDAAKTPPGRVSVTVDVQELGPIDLEVTKKTREGYTMCSSSRCVCLGFVTRYLEDRI